MSQGVRIPAPKRARRSHAERTADTGGRVKLAVIESITISSATRLDTDRGSDPEQRGAAFRV